MEGSGTSGGELWAVVLAAGEGSRLLPLARQLHDEDRPKQFVKWSGGESPLAATAARLERLVGASRIVVVVGERHLPLAEAQLARFAGLDLVGQPRKMGTGPGLLLPLARVLARSPRARVIVTPSDHHLQDPERFLAHVEPGLRAAEAAPAGVCLLGVPAARPAVDLGWIVPGAPLPATPGAALIERFVEKPAPEVATALFEAGALWNTFVLVGGASRLWSTAARQLREQARAFEPYFPAVDGPGEGAALSRVFDRIAPADFSRDVLARAEGLASLRVEGTGWTDWGTPERLLESLAGTPDLLDLKRRLARGPARPGLPASV